MNNMELAIEYAKKAFYIKYDGNTATMNTREGIVKAHDCSLEKYKVLKKVVINNKFGGVAK